METIQWSHPEDIMPFVVRDYRILDDKSRIIVEVKDNFQTINTHLLKNTVLTKRLRLEFERESYNVPVSLFYIHII